MSFIEFYKWSFIACFIMVALEHIICRESIKQALGDRLFLAFSFMFIVTPYLNTLIAVVNLIMIPRYLYKKYRK